MKILKIILPAVIAFTSLHAGAQTVDDIVSKNIEAMGGAAKLTSLNSVKMSGSMSAQGMDLPMTITKLNKKGMRMDMEIMGTSNYQIVTPDKGYTFFPIRQMTEPQEMDADALKAGQLQLDLTGALYNYKAKGETVELVGTEKVDGNDAYHLKLSGITPNPINYYIDTKTNRLVKTESKIKGPDGSDMDFAVSYSDYKQNADGYWFAYTMVQPQGTITFDKVETNVPVDESIFKN